MEQAIVYGIARSGHNWMTNVVKSWLGTGWQVHGMESVWPWEFQDILVRDFALREYPDWPVVVLNRDYLNWFASWIKMTKGKNIEMRDKERVMIWADRWQAIHQEYNGITDYIPYTFPVDYDSFVQSEKYRRIFCEDIGGRYNDGILDFVPGTGSSFDSQETHQGKGRQMKVLERWKWLLTPEGEPYQEWLKLRPGVMEYYLQHYDIQDDKKQFIESLTLINI